MENQGRQVISRNYAFWAEPEDGINNPGEFNDALCSWAAKEHHDLEILEESMEPQVVVDGVKYTCLLGEPNRGPVEHGLLKKLNLPMYNRPFGGCLGYKWIYFYKAEA